MTPEERVVALEEDLGKLRRAHNCWHDEAIRLHEERTILEELLLEERKARVDWQQRALTSEEDRDSYASQRDSLERWLADERKLCADWQQRAHAAEEDRERYVEVVADLERQLAERNAATPAGRAGFGQFVVDVVARLDKDRNRWRAAYRDLYEESQYLGRALLLQRQVIARLEGKERKPVRCARCRVELPSINDVVFGKHGIPCCRACGKGEADEHHVHSHR